MKLLLSSLLVSLIAIPLMAAREPTTIRSLRKAARLALLFNVLYLAFLCFFFGRL